MARGIRLCKYEIPAAAAQYLLGRAPREMWTPRKWNQIERELTRIEQIAVASGRDMLTVALEEAEAVLLT